jgi:hypothetical protein
LAIILCEYVSHVCSTILAQIAAQFLKFQRFADRDLMMRFRGGGVGHKSTREATNFFKMDRDRLDIGATLDDDCDVAIEFDDDEELESDEIVDEETVDQQQEDNYGYTKEDSDSDDAERAEVGYEESDTDEDLGPEDDGGAVDPFMDELGYADM